MKVNVDLTLKNIDGSVLIDRNEKGEAVEAILKTALINAVLTPVEREKGVEKVRKFQLAQRLYAGGEVDLTLDDVKLLKERVGDVYSPLIVGQIYELLPE